MPQSLATIESTKTLLYGGGRGLVGSRFPQRQQQVTTAQVQMSEAEKQRMQEEYYAKALDKSYQEATADIQTKIKSLQDLIADEQRTKAEDPTNAKYYAKQIAAQQNQIAILQDGLQGTKEQVVNNWKSGALTALTNESYEKVQYQEKELEYLNLQISG